MSEEQSNFKVTDRRLFNADGSPRDIEREAEPETPAASEVVEESSPAAAPQTASTDSQPSSAEQESPPASSSSEPLVEDAGGISEEGLPGANDPASFVNFLMSIASNAAAALGMMEHPVTGERGVDLPLGKHWIDILGMLKEKTRGNLLPQEDQIFEGLLSDLRMQYVSLTTAPRTPRGFTGSDITGGR